MGICGLKNGIAVDSKKKKQNKIKQLFIGGRKLTPNLQIMAETSVSVAFERQNMARFCFLTSS